MDFVSFGKIPPISKLTMTITQKLHGTNAQILIKDKTIQAGSRTRWITPEDDNYGFASFVQNNKDELIKKLGDGRHFGEWCGKGINSAEGLEHRMLCLFNAKRWVGKELPDNVGVVPILYHGRLSLSEIEECMITLREQGSRLVPGYMNPKGIVIEIGDNYYKKVFNPEETGWAHKIKLSKEHIFMPDINHLLQPIRLQKLLSKDERYSLTYPSSLSDICKDYVADLRSEMEIDDIEIKSLGRNIYQFVKTIMAAA